MQFQEPIQIEGFPLLLTDAAGTVMGRFDHDGNLVVGRDFAGTVVHALEVIGATGELLVGAPRVAGTVRVVCDVGDAIVLEGKSATAVLGTKGREGNLLVRDRDGRAAQSAFRPVPSLISSEAPAPTPP